MILEKMKLRNISPTEQLLTELHNSLWGTNMCVKKGRYLSIFDRLCFNRNACGRGYMCGGIINYHFVLVILTEMHNDIAVCARVNDGGWKPVLNYTQKEHFPNLLSLATFSCCLHNIVI